MAEAIPTKHQTYATIPSVMKGQARQLKRAAKDTGLMEINLKQFMSVGKAGEVLAQMDPLHFGLGVYIFSSVKLQEAMNLVSQKIKAYEKEGVEGDAGAVIPVEEMVPLLQLQGKLAEALANNGTNIITARTAMRRSNIPMGMGGTQINTDGGPVSLLVAAESGPSRGDGDKSDT